MGLVGRGLGDLRRVTFRLCRVGIWTSLIGCRLVGFREMYDSFGAESFTGVAFL